MTFINHGLASELRNTVVYTSADGTALLCRLAKLGALVPSPAWIKPLTGLTLDSIGTSRKTGLFLIFEGVWMDGHVHDRTRRLGVALGERLELVCLFAELRVDC